jgi:hypothetical protein
MAIAIRYTADIEADKKRNYTTFSAMRFTSKDKETFINDLSELMKSEMTDSYEYMTSNEIEVNVIETEKGISLKQHDGLSFCLIPESICEDEYEWNELEESKKIELISTYGYALGCKGTHIIVDADNLADSLFEYEQHLVFEVNDFEVNYSESSDMNIILNRAK